MVDVPPSEVGNDLHSTELILILFIEQFYRKTAERRGGACVWTFPSVTVLPGAATKAELTLKLAKGGTTTLEKFKEDIGGSFLINRS